METDKVKYLTQTDVLGKGFTKKMIEKLLPAPTLKKNPAFKSASPMKLWEESVVLAAMETPEFKQMFADAEKRRATAKKGVETKKKKTEELLEKVLPLITVKVIEPDKLKTLSLQAKQERYDLKYGPGERDARTADEATKKRWQVNYIRHNLCQYDGTLDIFSGKVGKIESIDAYKETVLHKIAEAYPYLADECERQIHMVHQPLPYIFGHDDEDDE